MPRLRHLVPVDADYATTGPNHHTLRRSIPASTDVLFGCLEDGQVTKKWQGVDVEWTSRPPLEDYLIAPTTDSNCELR